MKNKKPNGKKPKGSSDLEKRVKKLEGSVRAEETKRKFTQFNEVAITNSATLPVWTQINNLSQGDAANNIEGVSYALTGISMKFLLHNTTSNPCVVRCAIIRLKSGQTISSIGESLLTGSAQLGLDFSSASEYQRYYLPINTKRYDVIMQRTIKLGAKNSTYTEQFTCNKLIKGYKRFNNRKEFTNNSSGSMDTNYYFVSWLVDSAMDTNTITVELTGETCFYFKDN